ncbi:MULTISPECIES: monovalent cation/H(+) antiporter subunit G [unclassified Cryobacterium]|uniref:monovalent cation/H(+) antiporter subunit G n=1 Tax=unclassified Cryobacterium TaxID=2649013 RepID=UPI001447A980|nr:MULTISPECIES: monovalent cation/H(+) antiporter subunit G [unclassified Cryobacterium]
MLDIVIDVLTAVFLIVGAFLSFAAGVGLIRFSDAIARMHATTKPQILGLMVILAAIGLQSPNWSTILLLIPILVFQMLTAPIAAHMVGRAGYRTGVMAEDSLLIDELAGAIERAQQESGGAGTT